MTNRMVTENKLSAGENYNATLIWKVPKIIKQLNVILAKEN